MVSTELRFVIDGPPEHEAGRFVEVEDAHGRSVGVGEWHERSDGHWELRVERRVREKLPDRRDGESIKFDVQRRDGPRQTYHATVGRYPDGRVGEVFLAAGKIGSDAEVLMRDSAIALSFALQYGCPLEEIRAALTRDEGGRAEGPLGTIVDMLAERRT